MAPWTSKITLSSIAPLLPPLSSQPAAGADAHMQNAHMAAAA